MDIYIYICIYIYVTYVYFYSPVDLHIIARTNKATRQVTRINEVNLLIWFSRLANLDKIALYWFCWILGLGLKSKRGKKLTQNQNQQLLLVASPWAFANAAMTLPQKSSGRASWLHTSLKPRAVTNTRMACHWQSKTKQRLHGCQTRMI